MSGDKDFDEFLDLERKSLQLINAEDINNFHKVKNIAFVTRSSLKNAWFQWKLKLPTVPLPNPQQSPCQNFQQQIETRQASASPFLTNEQIADISVSLPCLSPIQNSLPSFNEQTEQLRNEIDCANEEETSEEDNVQTTNNQQQPTSKNEQVTQQPTTIVARKDISLCRDSHERVQGNKLQQLKKKLKKSPLREKRGRPSKMANLGRVSLQKAIQTIGQYSTQRLTFNSSTIEIFTKIKEDYMCSSMKEYKYLKYYVSGTKRLWCKILFCVLKK